MTATAYGKWHEQRVRRLLDRLARLQPGSTAANHTRWAASRLLFKAVTTVGLGAVDRTIAALNASGHHFERADHSQTRREWRESVGDRGGTIRVAVTASPHMRMASIQFTAPPPVLSARERETHRLQQAFYARYMEAGRRAYARPPRRIGAADRLLLLVGELEADVNNGGFDQYLHNKGRRRARAALAALKTIGARRTARLLDSALRPSVTRQALGTLDDQFHSRPEDLALLVMRHRAATLAS